MAGGIACVPVPPLRLDLSLLLAVIAGETVDISTPVLEDLAIRRLRERDPQAWRQLFEADGDAIYRYVFGRVGSAEDAEDLTAVVFEEAWKHASSLRDQGLPARAWLFGIARHVVGTHHRRLFRRAPIVSLDAFVDIAADVEPDSRLDLARALTRLKPALAEVVVMRFVHDLSLKETATALNTTIDAVKRKQARGIEELRGLMAGA